MATLVTGKTWISGEQVTPGGLNQTVNSATISGIVNAEIAANANIQLSKLQTGALPAGITVASANIVDGTIVNADISGVAGISHNKLAAVGVGQVLIGDAVTGTLTARTMTGDATLANNGIITIAANAVTSGKIATGAVTSAKIEDLTIVNGDISNSAAIALSKLATGALPTGITVASANLVDGTIDNDDISASAAIDGSKINPTFAGDVLIDDKIVHRSDTDTAIRFPFNDAVSVETGGTQRLLINVNGTLASDTGGSIFLRPSDGSLEIFRAAGQPFIDFKDNSADDFDCRIAQVANGLRFETGGNGATATRVDIKSTGQVRFVPLAADPTGAETGDVYYNSGENKLKVYNGSSWVNLH